MHSSKQVLSKTASSSADTIVNISTTLLNIKLSYKNKNNLSEHKAELN